MRSAVQLPTPTWHPLMEVSCSIWSRSTEVKSCFKTVWDTYAGSIARFASSVALSDRSAVAGATSAGSTLLSENFTLGTPSRTDDSPGIRVQRPVVQQAVSNSPGEPLDDSPLPNCPIRDVVLTDRDKQLLFELCWASAMALPRCVVSRYAVAWAESLEGAMRGHEFWAVLCRYRCRLLLAEISKRCRQELGAETTASVVGDGANRARRVQTQPDELRGKRAGALTARGSIIHAAKF